MRIRHKPKPADHYFEVRLIPAQHKALVGLLSGNDVPDWMLKELLGQAKLAQRFNFPAVDVDWTTAEEEAAKRGESIADYLGDAPWEL